MPLTGRGDSYAPAKFAEKVLPIGRKRGRARERLTTRHTSVSERHGARRTASGHSGLRGQRAVATVFAIVYTGDGLLNTALGLYKPWQWSRREAAIDVVNKLVLAEATRGVRHGPRSDVRSGRRDRSSVSMKAVAAHGGTCAGERCRWTWHGASDVAPAV